MAERYTRLLAYGVATSLAPFLLVVFFVWARDGTLPGITVLFGRGDLFPPAALLCGQALVACYRSPAPMRRVRWFPAEAVCWIVLCMACVGYVVPYSKGRGSEPRVAQASLAIFAFAAVVGAVALRPLPGSTEGEGRP